MLDHPVRLGLRNAFGAGHVSIPIEFEFGFTRFQDERRLAGSTGAQRGSHRPGACQRLAPGRRGPLDPVEYTVDALVVEPLVRADHRAIERAAANAIVLNDHFHRHRQPVLPGHE